MQKKQDLNKRKEVFLNDFYSSNKYKLLKDRLRKSVVQLIVDKFQKQGIDLKADPEVKNQMFSELYVYFNE